jgi:hypothetical protein
MPSVTAALFGSSISVHGFSGNNLAGLFEGDVQVNKNLTVTGNLSVTGTKNFVQAHPTDPSQEIVYVALERGEAETYVRGTGQPVSGKAVIALPEHFGLVTAYEDLTIQLTPRGKWLQLHLVELEPTQTVVPLSRAHAMSSSGIRHKHPDLAVLSLARRPAVLPFHLADFFHFLRKPISSI